MPATSLHSLTLINFRSHRRLDLTLDGRPVAIWGPNGAGKTNILEAVSMLSPGRGLRRAAAGEIARRPDAPGWKVAAALRGIDAHELETWVEGGDTRQLRIDGKPAPQIMLGRVMRMLWLVPAMDRLWIEAAEGRRRFLDRITLSFNPGHAEAVLAYEKAMRERNRLLKDQVADPHWYSALESQMATSAAEIEANRCHALNRILNAQAGVDSAFPAAELALTGPDPDSGLTVAELPAFWSAGRRRDMAAGRTLAGPHRVDLRASYAAKEMPADQCSTGEQKALLISLILANSRALAQDHGSPPVLLLDEVAAHLDAGRRSALYDEITALGAQAFLTGTGRELFDGLGHRAQGLELFDQGLKEGSLE
ncbi:MAG: DNA replication/repair protein RecF [Paracoccaceae bacterium]